MVLKLYNVTVIIIVIHFPLSALSTIFYLLFLPITLYMPNIQRKYKIYHPIVFVCVNMLATV